MGVAVERWLTINEACALVRVSRSTMFLWLRRGLVDTRITIGGHRRIREASLWRDAKEAAWSAASMTSKSS